MEWLVVRARERRFSTEGEGSHSVLLVCLLGGLGVSLFLSPSAVLGKTFHLALSFLSGAVGFFYGMKVELRILRKMSRAVLGLSLFQALFTLLVVTVPLYVLFGMWGQTDFGMELFRISAVLGIAASVTRYPTMSALSSRMDRKSEGSQVAMSMALLGNLLAFLSLGFLLAFHKGAAISFLGVEIEGAIGRLVLVLVCGGLLGGLADFANSVERPLHERHYLVVGVLLVGTGAATALGFPPVLVCMIAGMWLINATTRRLELHEMGDRIRLGVEGAFLVVIGASLSVLALVRSGEAWVALGIGLLLFASRVVGKRAGTDLGARMFAKLSEARRNEGELALLPQGGIALAVVYGQGLSEVLMGGIVISVLLALFAAPYGFRRAFRGTGNVAREMQGCPGCVGKPS
ncbi:MAG: cation:proton antiporter [Candidatus Latescibacterota bacterium]